MNLGLKQLNLLLLILAVLLLIQLVYLLLKTLFFILQHRYLVLSVRRQLRTGTAYRSNLRDVPKGLFVFWGIKRA